MSAASPGATDCLTHSPPLSTTTSSSAAGEKISNPQLPGACTAAGAHLYSALQQQYAAATAAAIAANAHHQLHPYAQQPQPATDNVLASTATPSEQQQQLVGKKRSAENDIFQMVFSEQYDFALICTHHHHHQHYPPTTDCLQQWYGLPPVSRLRRLGMFVSTPNPQQQQQYIV